MLTHRRGSRMIEPMQHKASNQRGWHVCARVWVTLVHLQLGASPQTPLPRERSLPNIIGVRAAASHAHGTTVRAWAGQAKRKSGSTPPKGPRSARCAITRQHQKSADRESWGAMGGHGRPWGGCPHVASHKTTHRRNARRWRDPVQSYLQRILVFLWGARGAYPMKL